MSATEFLEAPYVALGFMVTFVVIVVLCLVKLIVQATGTTRVVTANNTFSGTKPQNWLGQRDYSYGAHRVQTGFVQAVMAAEDGGLPQMM